MQFPNRIIFLFFITFFTCNAQSDSIISYEIDVSKYLLGTLIDAKVIHKDINYAQKSLYTAFREIERIEHKFGTKFNESIVNNINSNSGIKPIEVDEETFSLLSRAVHYSENYEALFDITVGPLTELWGFNSDDEIEVPTNKEISNLLHLISYKLIILDSSKRTVFLAKKGMMIDLGGVAKGYAIDMAANILNEKKIENFMINAGGDIVCYGKNSKGKDWVIGVKHPRKPKDILAKFRVSNISVSTSGDYERYIIIGDKRYHHIFEPSTGLPGELCQSVTVFHENSEEGTALAKYIFLLGYKKFSTTVLSKKIKYIIVEKNGLIKYNPKLISENELQFIGN